MITSIIIIIISVMIIVIICAFRIVAGLSSAASVFLSGVQGCAG